jgi:hypothetical protein
VPITSVRFYIDPETGLPHIYNHNVVESEAEEILAHPSEDRLGEESSRVAVGQTEDGRYLRVIYVPDPEPSSVFRDNGVRVAWQGINCLPAS